MRALSFIGRKFSHPTSWGFFLFIFKKGFVCVYYAEIISTFNSGDSSEAVMGFLWSV